MDTFRNFKKDRKLLDALRGKDTEKACEAIEEGANPYLRDEKRNSLLHIAIMHKDKKTIEFLLEKNIDMRNLTNNEGRTPYHVAISIDADKEIEDIVYYKPLGINKNE